MINTLDLGKYIYSTLSEKLDCKIYPLIADNDAKYPFVIYRRTNLVSNGCKDGVIEDSVDIEITIVSDTYHSSIELAKTIRNLLEKQQVSYNGIFINDASITMANEEYSNNSYIQRMNFKFIITD